MTKKNEPIRIAQVIGKWLGGGVEAVIMNYYRHIDRNIIQFDFICDSDSTNIPYDEIKKLGGKVILIPPYQKIFKYEKELIRIFKENNYIIVHSNINALSVFPLRAAKKAGVPIRIAHSHSTANKKEWKKTFIKSVLRPFSKVYATHYFACSELAGRWLFGNKTFDRGKVTIINNAIDVDKFKFDKKMRNNKRKEFGIKESTLVVGHVGRFVAQKNHTFLIDIFYEFLKENDDCLLLLIGQGPREKEIKDKVKTLGIENKVIFLGQRNDVADIYQAMDIFLFPSLYEGFGMVLIEAQCSGLPCVASTKVPFDSKISNNIVFVNLQSGSKTWKESSMDLIIENSERNNKQLDLSKFKIEIESKKIVSIFTNLIKENEKKQSNEIAILTWLHNGNYGSVLQAFALQKYLQLKGYNVINLNYNASLTTKLLNWLNSHNSVKLFIGKFVDLKIKKNKEKSKKFSVRAKKIERFKHDNMKVTKLCKNPGEIKKISKNYNTFICGSDQIWSPALMNPIFYFSFLKDDVKKISYAASFGVTQTSSLKQKKIKKLLERFDFISVRELEGQQFIKKITNLSVPVLTDPTLLIDRNTWNQYAGEKPYYNKPYIFCYMLKDNREYLKNVKMFADQKKIDVIIVPTTKGPFNTSFIEKIDIGPTEWLNLIKNATYIFTDSFHGGIFSLIFHKELVLFKRFSDSDKVSENSRIYTLAKKFKIENRVIDQENLNKITKLEKIDYSFVDKTIENDLLISAQWLMNAINERK